MEVKVQQRVVWAKGKSNVACIDVVLERLCMTNNKVNHKEEAIEKEGGTIRMIPGEWGVC